MSPRGPSPTRLDAELRAGSSAHYEDALYYDYTYRSRTDDVAFYTALATRTRGPILEYGAGSGRIALPMARVGARVTCVDASAPMTKALRDRLRAESSNVRKRVRVRTGDMRRLKLGTRFSLVLCTFNTALHLYSRRDVEQFFARVRDHLEPGGRFVCDLSVPFASDLARDPDRAYSAPRFRHPSDRRIVKNREFFDYDPVRQVLFVAMEFEPVDAPNERWMTPLAHRQFFPQEWEALLHYNGFDVESVHGGFRDEPLTDESDVMVWTARVARDRRDRSVRK